MFNEIVIFPVKVILPVRIARRNESVLSKRWSAMIQTGMIANMFPTQTTVVRLIYFSGAAPMRCGDVNPDPPVLNAAAPQ